MNTMPEQMRAAVFYKPYQFKIENVDIPKIGPNDVLIKVKYCGICGTDYHIYNGSFPIANTPLIPGHEFSGIAAQKGAEVAPVNIGDSVTADINMSCEQCYFCRRGQKFFCPHLSQMGVHVAGAFAEYIKVPQRYIHKLPKDMSFENGAYVEPLACVVHAHERINIRLGSSVAIIGAGAMGLTHAQIAKLRGASNIIMSEINPSRLERAREIVVDHVIDVGKVDFEQEILKLTEGRGIDYVIEAVGSISTYKQALKVLGRGGTLLAYGAAPATETMEIKPFDIYNREFTIVGSYAGSYGTWAEAISLLQSKRFDLGMIITKKIPLEELPTLLEKEDRTQIKVLVSPELQENSINGRQKPYSREV